MLLKFENKEVQTWFDSFGLFVLIAHIHFHFMEREAGSSAKHLLC